MLSENSNPGFILLAALLFTVYCFVFGQSGVLERMRLQKEKAILQNEITLLQKENGRLSAELADQISGKLAKFECENAGYLAPGGKAYHFRNMPLPKDALAQRRDSKLFSIEHLRIAWISFSLMALAAFYLLVRRTRRRANETVTNDETDY